MVRQKIVAVLYADSAWPHPDAIQLDAIESLTSCAGLAVSLIAAARPVPSGATKAEAAPEPVAAEVAATAPRAEPAPALEEPSAIESAQTQTPTVEAAMPSAAVQNVEAITSEAVTDAAAETTY